MNSRKKAIITGVSGQDGVFLSEELTRMGYQTLGLTRSIVKARKCFPTELASIQLLETDYSKTHLKKILEEFGPEEIYHFAAQPYVGKSWNLIDETLHGTAVLTANLLDVSSKIPGIKFFNASSSEIFADTDQVIDEDFPKTPNNPYGCAKLFSYHMVQSYRENYGMFAVNGILFNHESERRYTDFFSQKLVNGVLDVYTKKNPVVKLGNLDIVRDWGSAEEYMSAVPKLMQLPQATDVNICSSKGKRALDVVEYVFSLLNLDYKKSVVIDSDLVRNRDKKSVIGSNKKISQLLGWTPKVTIEEILKKMLRAEAKNRGLSEIS